MIPFLDLKAQYETIGDELELTAIKVLRKGDYILGDAVASFERNFAAYCGATEAVALNTGTSALHLALLAVGVQPGDEVITVPMTFVATAAAIQYAQAKPVFVDIDEATWTMDPAQLERAITPRTKAIIPVHLHGRLADMPAIMAIADRYNVPVIEDAAQAHGAIYNAKRAGTFGTIGCFSFYPGKNLGACGEGGGLITDRAELAQKVRQLRDWGQTAKYKHDLFGFNYRMDALQGAFLDVKLKYLDIWTNQRRSAARLYDQLLSRSGFACPAPPRDLEHVYHVYAIRASSRTTLQEKLKSAGVMTNIHYPCPVHLQPAFASLGYEPGAFPISEQLAVQTLSLPIYPEISPAQIEYVCNAIGRSATTPTPVHVGA